MKPSQDNISKKQLRCLAEFLDAEHEDATPMNLTQAHGFLRAIASAPNLIMPSEWQPTLLGGYPEFSSIEEAKEVIDALTALYNSASRKLRSSGKFCCLLWEDGQRVAMDDCRDTTIKNWCEGYLEGVSLDSDWLADEVAVAQLFPLGVLSERFDMKKEKDANGNILEDDTAFKLTFKEDLHTYVKENYLYWQKARKTRTSELNFRGQHQHCLPKIGRNDPCFCGSGKKYKKCCGNQATMH